ncbi:hypothetical protein [Dolichospermum compactum]|nr:hypothetical protein [Dolichospermum compactum]
MCDREVLLQAVRSFGTQTLNLARLPAWTIEDGIIYSRFAGLRARK